MKPSALQDPNSDLWALIGGYNPLYGSMHPEIYSGYNYLSGESYDTFVARTSGTGVTGGYGGYNSSTQSDLVYNAFSWLNTTAGFSLTQADCAAYTLKLKLPVGMTVAGILSGLAGAADNLYEYSQTSNERDLWQSGIGAATTLAVTFGVLPGGQPVAFIIGVGLFIWEISEEV